MQRSIPQATMTAASAQNTLQQAIRNPASQTAQHLAGQAIQHLPLQTVQNLGTQAIQNPEAQAAQNPAARAIQERATQAAQNRATQVAQDPLASVAQNPAAQPIPNPAALTLHTAAAQAVENPALQAVQSAAGQWAEDRTNALAVPPALAASSSGVPAPSRSDPLPVVAPRQQAFDPASTTTAPVRSEARDAPPVQAAAEASPNGVSVAATSAKLVNQPLANSPITVPVMAPPVASANIQDSASPGAFGLNGLPLPLFNPFLARRIGKRRGGGGLGLAIRGGGLWAILRLFGRARRSQAFVAASEMGEDRAPPRLAVRIGRWLSRLLRRSRSFPKRST